MSDVVEKQPLTEDYLKKMDAYWRAANYLGACLLYTSNRKERCEHCAQKRCGKIIHNVYKKCTGTGG